MADLSFSVNLDSLDVRPMPDVALADAGIKERADLQRWVEAYPEIVERDLLVVTTEFDQWEVRERKVADRLDVLYLDAKGSLLVAELKRGEAPDTTELQALKYAAYCDQLTVSDVVEQFARYHDVPQEQAREAIVEHAPALADRELGPVRVRIVAGAFGPSVTHVALWLSDLGLDIGCIEVTARRHDDRHVVLTSRQILPPPAAEDYLVRRRRREAEEDIKEASTRRRNSVVVLEEAGIFEAGDEVTLNLVAFTPEQRTAVEEHQATNPDYARAVWTGLGSRKALRWKYDGNVYSASGLVWTMLNQLGFNPGSVPGPDYWLTSTGQTLYERAASVEDDSVDGGGGAAALTQDP